MAMPPVSTSAQHIILIAHGLGDTAATWSNQLKSTMQQQLAQEGDAIQLISLDWNPYSIPSFRCSVNGKRIGAILGQAMSVSKQLESVHLIGHSCGSFVVLGLCESLKAKRKNILTQSTYLDPVSIYGGVFWNYGINRFGSCADFSEAYIDHEDAVPGSNQRLPNTHTFDVTQARKKNHFDQSPHIWPTVYYQQLVETGNQPSLRKTPALPSLYPPGILQQISTLQPSPLQK